MAEMPSNHGVTGDLVGPGLDGQVEVVGDGQDLAQQVLAGEAGVALALLGRAAPEVLELGALALQPGEVLLRGLRASASSPLRVSISASSLVGEMSISSTRRCPRCGAQAYRWSTSSFIRLETKRTVPIACE